MNKLAIALLGLGLIVAVAGAVPASDLTNFVAFNLTLMHPLSHEAYFARSKSRIVTVFASPNGEARILHR